MILNMASRLAFGNSLIGAQNNSIYLDIAFINPAESYSFSILITRIY